MLFLRKVWYLGWKPTVSRTLSIIVRSLNDVIKGSLFETLPSITLTLGSTAFGTGVGYLLLASFGTLHIDVYQGWTYQRVKFNNCSV
jgi:hypothetical protein